MTDSRTSANAHEPAHGTRSRYQSPAHRCRCTECRAAQSAYRASRKNIDSERVPVIESRQKLSKLLNAGMTLVQIADLSGVSRRTLTRIMRDEEPENIKIDKVSHDAIMVMKPTPNESTWVDPTVAREQLRELTLNGWRQSDLAVRMGYRQGNALHRLINSRSSRIRVTTANAVDRLYRELRNVPGPSVKASKLAQLKWDEAEKRGAASVPNFDNGFHDRRYDRRNRQWPGHLSA